MNKVCFRLSIPCLEQDYDVMIPTFLPVGEIVKLLSKSIVTLSDGKYIANGNELLCLKGRNIVLDYQHPFSDYGIQNGDQLVLI